MSPEATRAPLPSVSVVAARTNSRFFQTPYVIIAVFIVATFFGGALEHYVLSDYNPPGESTVVFNPRQWDSAIAAQKDGNKVIFYPVEADFNFGNNIWFTLYDGDLNIIWSGELGPEDARSMTVELPQEPVRVSMTGASAGLMYRTF